MNQEPINLDDEITGNFFCSSCEKQINDNIIFFSGHPYHQHCVECMICHKNYTTSDTIMSLLMLPQDFFSVHIITMNTKLLKIYQLKY